MERIVWKHSRSRLYAIAAAVAVFAAVAAVAAFAFVPPLREWGRTTIARLGILEAPKEPQALSKARPHADDHGDHGHAHNGHGHDDDHSHSHDHPGHDDATAIELSPQAVGNVGLETMVVELRPFDRALSVPAIVIERPGRSTLQVTAPLTGVVTRIHPLEGQAIEPGKPLFEMRLTHEDLVEAQSELLRALGELDVTKREVARLDRLTESGAVAGRVRLERVYEQQKLEAAIAAQRQALVLHGLSEAQIEGIIKNRTLLKELTIAAPPVPGGAPQGASGLLQVKELNIEPGQHVNAGERLAALADHAMLFLRGTAFEQDAPQLRAAAESGASVTAVFESAGADSVVEGLSILYVANRIDPESRALYFYVRLPNELVRDVEVDGARFVEWKYKPGQRARLRVGVEQWPDQIVLPADAVVQEGAEAYVFERNQGHFDRVPVQVLYRDSQWAVVKQGGLLEPGDVVAANGAYQLQLALKNRAGGGADAHAGHSH